MISASYADSRDSSDSDGLSCIISARLGAGFFFLRFCLIFLCYPRDYIAFAVALVPQGPALDTRLVWH